jgi:hypothetical protein
MFNPICKGIFDGEIFNIDSNLNIECSYFVNLRL